MNENPSSNFRPSIALLSLSGRIFIGALGGSFFFFLCGVFGFSALAREARDDSVRILFAGDTHFNWGVEELQLAEGRLAPVKSVAPLFHGADYRVVNLETALTDKGKPPSGKSNIFRADPANIEVLKFLRTDAVLLGNNHSMDMGSEGLFDTIARLNGADIRAVGAGENVGKALEPLYFKIGNIRFSLFSFNEIPDLNVYASDSGPGAASLLQPGGEKLDRKAKSKIIAAGKKSDHVLISLHWGIEYYRKPTSGQIRLARELLDLGVSAVIGHHPHTAQGVEVYRKGVIAYSIGNFLFGSVNPRQSHNILLELVFDVKSKKLRRIRILPIWGTYGNGGHAVHFISERERKVFWPEFYALCSELAPGKRAPLRITPAGVGEMAPLK